MTELKALLDSGASSNFIHQDTVEKLKVKTTDRKEPQPMNDIQGKPLGWISKYAMVIMNIDNHEERINFNVIPLGIHGLVLGLPWLQKHNPEIKWSERKLRLSSTYCKQNCIRKKSRNQKGKEVPLAQKRLEDLELEDEEIDDFSLNAIIKNPIEHHESGNNRTKNQQQHPIEHHESGENKNLQGVPIEYHNFEDVFDLQGARRMPRDRGIWNFKIEFIEGWENKLPKVAKSYQLTQEEQKLEEETIEELLESSMIRPSTSPIGAPCFFVAKKDGTKRYVVD